MSKNVTGARKGDKFRDWGSGRAADFKGQQSGTHRSGLAQTPDCERSRDGTSPRSSDHRDRSKWRSTTAWLWLLLVDDGRPAHARRSEVDTHLDAVGDFDEGNAAGHPIVLTVKGHCPCNDPRTCSFAGESQMQGLGLGDTPNGKRSLDIKGLGAGLHNRGRVKRDQRILIDVEEIVALQRPVLESAPRIHAGCLDLNVQNGTLRSGRGERKRSIPLVERTFEGYRRRYLKLDLALYWRNLENRNVRRRLCRCWSCQKT